MIIAPIIDAMKPTGSPGRYHPKVRPRNAATREPPIPSNEVMIKPDGSRPGIKKLAKQQKWLLRAAISATRVGGHIVYSTCTLSPEENERVTEWILNKEPHSVKQERIDISNLTIHDGRIYPSRQMEGFYIAKFIKVASNIL
jgi:16S rRNA C967 or C1407 C5-methylase (RsmB/RsmF family)